MVLLCTSKHISITYGSQLTAVKRYHIPPNCHKSFTVMVQTLMKRNGHVCLKINIKTLILSSCLANIGPMTWTGIKMFINWCKITFDTSIILRPRAIATWAHRAAALGLHSGYRCSRSNASANHKVGCPGCLWTTELSARTASELWPCRWSVHSNSCYQTLFNFRSSWPFICWFIRMLERKCITMMAMSIKCMDQWTD